MARPDIFDNLKQMDLNNGIPFVINKRKVPTLSNICSLVIGLGGTGLDAMLETKGYVNMTCRGDTPESTPTNVAYLGFETDERDENKTSSKYTGGVTFSKELGEFVKISNPHISSLVDPTRRHLVGDNIKEWLDFAMNPGSGTDGAAGKRQAGRLLLMRRIKKVKEKLESTLRRLLENRPNAQLKIYILSGIGGGTGSGTFIDMAYIARYVASTIIDSARISVYGHIFLPDVNLSRDGLHTDAKTYIKRNGYAALKELDYWTNIGSHKARFKQDYGENVVVDSNLPPFDFVHLYSATTSESMLIKNGYIHCISAAAQGILSFIANEKIVNENTFAMASFYSNIATMVDGFEVQFPERNYNYIVIGAGSYNLPIDQIMMYVTHLLFRNMSKIYDNTPTNEEIESFLGRMRLRPGQLLEYLYPESNIPIPNYQQYTWEQVCSKTPSWNPRSFIDTEYTKVVEQQINSAYESFTDSFPGFFENTMHAAFVDASRGPVYVNRAIINNLPSTKSIIGELRTYRAAVERDIEVTRTETNRLKDMVETTRATASQAVLAKKDKKNDYLRALNEYGRNRLELIAKTKMLTAYTDAINIISTQNNVIYETVTETLRQLDVIFERNAQIIMNSTETKNDNERAFVWDTLRVPDISYKLEQMISRLGSSDDMIERFVKTLLDKIDQWVGTNANVSKFIRDYLGDNLGDIATQSLEAYVEWALTGEDGHVVNLEESVLSELAPMLDDNSQPLLKMCDPMSVRTGGTVQMVSIPSDCRKIINGFTRYQSAAENNTFSIQESSIKNRIFMLTAKCAVPMAAYADLYEYEIEYMNSVDKGLEDMHGRHLVMGPYEDWTQLPSPIPYRSRAIGSTPPTIEKWEQRNRELFYEALKRNCIRKIGENTYEAVETVPVDMSVYSKENFIIDGKLSLPALDKAKNELKQMEKGLTPVHVNVGEEKVIRGGANEDLDGICEKFGARYKTCLFIKDEVEKQRDIEQALINIDEWISEIGADDQNVRLFSGAFMSGEIYRKPNSAIYVIMFEGQETELANAMNMPIIAEFTAFKAFLELKNTSASRLKYDSIIKNSRIKIDAMASDIDGSIAKITQIKSTVEKKFQFISNDYANSNTINGVTEEIYNFYNSFKSVVDTQLATLEMMAM